MDYPKFAVIGGGSWATALVKILCENLPKITWYMRNQAAIQHIKTHKHNPNYITSIEFDTQKISLTNDINQAIKSANYLILAIPSAFVSEELKKVSVPLKNKVIFSAIKGVIPITGKVIGEFLMEDYGLPMENIGVISGPCHAEEIALERLSYLTIACSDTQKAEQFASLVRSSFIRAKTSNDTLGVEYAGMLKNIYAISAGIAHGLGYGDNFQSVLMSNAIREMQSYINAINPTERDIKQSVYLGDLLVTGYSLFSRNRTLGSMIGKGYTLKSAFMELNMVAEGYYAVKSAYRNNQNATSPAKTPILDAVFQILYQGENARKVFNHLIELLD